MADQNANYEIIEELHRSSSWGNLVLKVKPRTKDKLYVLKCFPGIDSGLQKTIFHREMQALKVLNSCEGIVRIWDDTDDYHPDGDDSTKAYGAILMDYVYGDTLDQVDWNNIPPLKKYEICLKIAHALQNAHSNSVIHRDIKPSNIIYNADRDEITIIDFGSSKIKSIIDTETTMPMYSEGYSAPELVAGHGITEKCDYYSLGVVYYEILLAKKAQDQRTMLKSIAEWTSGREEVRSVLSSLLQQNTNDRPSSLLDVIDVFSALIDSLNTSQYTFHVVVDSQKLSYLKNKLLVPESMNMTQFICSYLRKQFESSYAFYDKKDSYVLIGAELMIYCNYKEDSGLFHVAKVFELPVDRRNKLVKRGFRITGKICFHPSTAILDCLAEDNRKLLVLFNNHYENDAQYRAQEELFDNLFSKWEQGLIESMEKEKSKSAILKHAGSFETSDGQLVLEISDCENKSVDEILPQTKFTIESRNSKGRPIYHTVGSLSEVVCDDDSVKMTFALPNGRIQPYVNKLLKDKVPLSEDFCAKTTAYRRQLAAIRALKTDKYSAHGLKDVILCMAVPEEIPTIGQPEFFSNRLNESQKQAVIKALNTESICLIQGPPGTGKTTVIKETVAQIIHRDIKTSKSPKILIVSQSHTAVDNILEGLTNIVKDSTEVVRIGADKNISQAISETYTIGAHQKHLIGEISARVNQHIEHKQKQLQGIADKRELDKWTSIREIQTDWLKRLADQESLDYQLICSATVIAGTCVGFLSNEVIKDMSFDYVIIDEAAKATTPELLVSIIKAKKIIMVGDQNQLPAYADAAVSPIIADLTKDPHYRLFDILYGSLPDTHRQILTTQYRMTSNIGNLISQVFYGGTIDTGCSDSEKLHGLTRFEGKSIVWFDTSANPRKEQRRTKGRSYINEEEKKIILEILV